MKIDVDGWSWIKLDDLGELNASVLRRKLTLVDSVKKSAITHRAYQEKDGALGIPRAFFRSSAVQDHEISIRSSSGLPWPERIKAKEGDLWFSAQDGDVDDLVLVDAFTGVKSEDFFSKDQKTGIAKILKSICGATVGDGMAIFASDQAAAKVCLSLIRTMKMRTLVLVPPGASLAMWRTVAGRYLPDAKLSTIRRGERDVDDAHITISTLDDIHDFMSHGRMSPGEFGFIVSHQINKMDPMAWVRVVPFLTAAKRLGLASPEASFTTGLSRAYRYHLGDPVFCADPDLDVPKIRRVWSTWKISNWARVNPQFVSKENLLDHMCASTTYNQHLVEQIVLALGAGRKIVVVSDRVAHLRTLKLQIETEWSGGGKAVDLAVDGMMPDDIAVAIGADVILTTFSFVKYLPEIEAADTVVLATPVRDPGSAVRVCLSKCDAKKPSVIVDMRCDSIPVCKDYGKSRDAMYQSSFGSDSG
jgi:hypothetical protein